MPHLRRLEAHIGDLDSGDSHAHTLRKVCAEHRARRLRVRKASRAKPAGIQERGDLAVFPRGSHLEIEARTGVCREAGTAQPGRLEKERKMNLEKFTERSRGFIQAAQTIAMRENHQRLSPEHLLKALMDDEEGMAANLIRKAGGEPRRVVEAVEASLAKIPKVTGDAVAGLSGQRHRPGARRGRKARQEGRRQLRAGRAAC